MAPAAGFPAFQHFHWQGDTMTAQLDPFNYLNALPPAKAVHGLKRYPFTYLKDGCHGAATAGNTRTWTARRRAVARRQV
jgi:hypothetical protein